MTPPYARPGFFIAHVFNPLLSLLAGRLGVNVRGAQVLSVQGRRSGRWHSIPVNPLRFAGQRYLVAPRGETEWVRNIRVSRTARLTFRGTTETVRVEEVADPDKPAILRAYLAQWALETARFFHGARADSSDAEFARVAPQHPVFRILP